MKTPKERKIGEAFRAMVMPIKIKNGLPTVISVGGQMYTLLHRDQQPLSKTPPRQEKEGKADDRQKMDGSRVAAD